MTITARNDSPPTAQVAMTGFRAPIDIVVPCLLFSILQLTNFNHATFPSWADIYRSRNSERRFTAETQSSQRSEYFLITNSLPREVSSLLDRYNQNGHGNFAQARKYSNAKGGEEYFFVFYASLR